MLKLWPHNLYASLVPTSIDVQTRVYEELCVTLKLELDFGGLICNTVGM